jgi:circadian clock protein KaiB
MPRKIPLPEPPVRYVFRLYVAGANEKSRSALVRIRQLCETEIQGRYELEVIDIYQQPELAKLDQIIATPTLLKILPLPARRFIGDFSNTSGFLSAISK